MKEKDLRKNGGKKMKTCEECGKKLGMFHGYIHPTLGNDYLLVVSVLIKFQKV